MKRVMMKLFALLLFGVSATASAQDWLYQVVTPPTPQNNMFFGTQVKVSGDTAFVSAPGESINGNATQGAVYVYTRDIYYKWILTQKLVAADGSAGAQFGSAVAMKGDRAIITAKFSTENGKMWQGSAYYFVRSNNIWTQVQKIALADGQAYDTFGNAVAMTPEFAFINSGGTTRITVPGGQTVTVPRIVHVFRLGTSGVFTIPWEKTQTIPSPVADPQYGSFGAAMAASGATLLVGARTRTVDGAIGRGSVYEYGFNGTSWVAKNVLIANDGGARDNFGNDLAIDGNTAMIGSPGAVIDGNVSRGAVYRFERVGGSWYQAQKLLASDGTATNLFGASVGMSQGRLLSGAYAADNYKGAAYLFRKGSPDWGQDRKFVAPVRTSGFVFGYYVALDDRTALISSYNAVVSGVAGAGTVYFFTDPCWPDPTICIAKTNAGFRQGK